MVEDAAALRAAPLGNWGALQKLAATRRGFDNWLSIGLASRLSRAADRVALVPPSIRDAIWNWPIDVRPRRGPEIKVRIRDLGPIYDVFLRREYDFTVIDWARIRTVVDCGANVGAFTAWTLAHADVEVLAVEPAPSAVEVLRRFAAGHDGRVRILEAAVARSPGEMDFHETLGGTSSLIGWRKDWDPHVQSRKVKVMTLPDVIEHSGFERVDLLKIDIEGGEIGMFPAAARVLDRVGTLLMEVHTQFGAKVDAVTRAAESAGMRAAAETTPTSAFVVAWRE